MCFPQDAMFMARQMIATLVRMQIFRVPAVSARGRQAGNATRRGGEEGETDWPPFCRHFPQLETFALLRFKVSGAACLAALGLFVLISAFYLLGFLRDSPGKSCHGTFNKKRKQAQKFPFAHRITARFQSSESMSSSKFYDGIMISATLPNTYCVSTQKMQSQKPTSNYRWRTRCALKFTAVAGRTGRRRQLRTSGGRLLQSPSLFSAPLGRSPPEKRMLKKKNQTVFLSFKHGEL